MEQRITTGIKTKIVTIIFLLIFIRFFTMDMISIIGNPYLSGLDILGVVMGLGFSIIVIITLSKISLFSSITYDEEKIVKNVFFKPTTAYYNEITAVNIVVSATRLVIKSIKNLTPEQEVLRNESVSTQFFQIFQDPYNISNKKHVAEFYRLNYEYLETNGLLKDLTKYTDKIRLSVSPGDDVEITTFMFDSNKIIGLVEALRSRGNVIFTPKFMVPRK